MSVTPLSKLPAEVLAAMGISLPSPTKESVDDSSPPVIENPTALPSPVVSEFLKGSEESPTKYKERAPKKGKKTAEHVAKKKKAAKKGNNAGEPVAKKERATKKEKNVAELPPPIEIPTPPVVAPTSEVVVTPVEEKVPIHIRRKNIPKHIKTLVWNKYIGCNKAEAKCISCKQERIDNRNFHCGHVVAESKGGDMTINNLRPICAPCNLSMGSRSMNEFTSEFFGWTV